MPDIALAIVLWTVVGALTGFAGAGWVTARLTRGRIPGALSGLLAGIVILLLLLGLLVLTLQGAVDLHSLGIELGFIPSPELLPPVTEALDRLSEGMTVPTEEVGENARSPAMIAQAWAGIWYAVALLAALLIGATIGGIAGDHHADRSLPRRRTALVSLAGVMALVAALTVWLWPDVRATALALTDMDQSAGPELGVNLTEVARHPEVMWGRTVTVSGLIDRVLGPEALLLGNNKPIVGDKVLVLSQEPLTELVTDGESGGVSVSEGKVARVTGEVHPLADIAPERLSTGLAGYEGQAVLIARQITLDVPAAGAAGDKELASGSDGPERGVTYNDVLDHPERYLGQMVIISAEIEEQFLTSHTFTLGDRGLLAVSAKPRRELFVEATAFVAGEVRRLRLAELERELGIDLDEAALRQYEGEPVIVVHEVEVVT